MIELDANWYVEESKSPPNPEQQSRYCVSGLFTILPVAPVEFIELKFVIKRDPIDLITKYDNVMRELEL